MNLKYSEIFRKAYLFNNLEPEELQPFLDSLTHERYSPNEVIISEGENGEFLYLILSGSVRVTKKAAEDIEQVIGLLREGEFFGEMALIDRRPRSASVYAHEPVELALFRHDLIYELFERNPAIGFKVVRTFAEVLSLRLRDTNEKLKTLLLVERTL